MSLFEKPQAMAPEAFHGVAGEAARAIAETSECDPAGLLSALLVGFGNAIGQRPFRIVENDQHFTNLYAVLVGDTSKGRKGTTINHARRLLKLADQSWEERCVATGLSSGEGLINRVRDGNPDIEGDAGVEDKRLLVIEHEFASVLKVAQREGNTLSPVVRNGWDSTQLQTLTKNNSQRASGAHISILGCITQEELVRNLREVEICNGFANRFLWISVERKRVAPEGGCLDAARSMEFAGRIRTVLEWSKTAGKAKFDDVAVQGWRAVYPALSSGPPGMAGAICARMEAQVSKLALTYATLDGQVRISRDHLAAALAVVDYARASVGYIFGDERSDPKMTTIAEALEAAGAKGLSRTDMFQACQGHIKAYDLDHLLRQLRLRGMARPVEISTEGRNREVWIWTGERDSHDSLLSQGGGYLGLLKAAESAAEPLYGERPEGNGGLLGVVGELEPLESPEPLDDGGIQGPEA